MLGAFVAAMLYDTVGPALLATLEPDQFQSTLGLNVNFLRPVRPGRVVSKGRVVHRNGDLAFIEASLVDSASVPGSGQPATTCTGGRKGQEGGAGLYRAMRATRRTVALARSNARSTRT